MKGYQTIEVKVEEFVGVLTLARPEKRNAFTPLMLSEIQDALLNFNKNKKVRLVLVKAKGPVFCAGMDLKIFQNPELEIHNPTISKAELPLASIMNLLEKPSIAIVEGDVVAGGFLIVLGCNYIFSKKEVSFYLPEVKRGIFPFQVMASLLKYLPENKALDLCISGKKINADDAYNLGIVYHLMEEEDKVLERLIQEIISNSPTAIQMGIKAMKALKNIPEKEHQTYLLEQLQNLKNSQDAKEGAKAFFEKRPPIWEN
jgi:enoyl-CoA hydratase/carnithine racemase